MCTANQFPLSSSARNGFWTAVLLLGLTSGCAALRTPETQITAASGAYEAVHITYQQSAGQFPRPTEAASGVQHALFTVPVPATERTSGPVKVRTLSLQYPHPAGRVGFALAELIIEKSVAADAASRQTPTSGGASEPAKSASWLSRFNDMLCENLPGVVFISGVEEAWALDISMAEVDSIVQALDAQGYFADAVPAGAVGFPAGGPMLAARVNGLDIQRQWRSASELNQLVWRVRSEGKLVSHRRPVARLRAAEAPAPPAPLVPHILRLPPVVEPLGEQSG